MKSLATQKMNGQQGFTLIELVVVIVILGILAVTAAPKFIDLQGDAKAATVEGVKAAMESSTAMIHSKSLIEGNDKDTAVVTINLNGDSALPVNIKNGWPTNSATTWGNLLDIDSTEFTILSDGTAGSGTTALVYVYPAAASITTAAEVLASECYARYQESSSTNTKPLITTVTDKC